MFPLIRAQRRRIAVSVMVHVLSLFSVRAFDTARLQPRTPKYLDKTEG